LKPEFFLGFGARETRRISYAASFGVSTLPEGQAGPLAKMLEPFDAVSLRERSGVEIVRKATGRDAALVVDPTLLLEEGDWRSVMAAGQLATGKYMLVYCLEESPLFMEAVSTFADLTGLRVVVIGGSVVNRFRMSSEVHIGIGPAEFLRLFADAELVVTNSFHGTAFGINFGRPLVSVLHMTRNDRMATLMESIGWPESQWDGNGEADEMLDLAGKRATASTGEPLARLRTHALRFLDEALGAP
jgi:polysaccharide pyruvyl transferase WcaK-like protein